VTFTCAGKDVDRVDYEDYHEMDMKMHNRPHPGEVLKTLCLETLDLTVTKAARSLGVSRKALSNILNGRAGISPEMAIRLFIALLKADSTSSFSMIAGTRKETASGST